MNDPRATAPLLNPDEYVTLKVTLPEKPDPELERFIAQWGGANNQRPRQSMEA